GSFTGTARGLCLGCPLLSLARPEMQGSAALDPAVGLFRADFPAKSGAVLNVPSWEFPGKRRKRHGSSRPRTRPGSQVPGPCASRPTRLAHPLRADTTLETNVMTLKLPGYRRSRLASLNRGGRKAARYRLTLEALEDRTAPAVVTWT